MGYRLLFILLLFFSIHNSGNAQSRIEIQTGDFIFLDLDCGPLCDAIESVTQSYKNQHFSHIGLVYKRNDTTFLIEALGKGVRLTPIKKFLANSKKPAYVGRVKSSNEKLIPGAIEFCLQQLGTPYDDQFIYDNGKYYCSELIYDAFKAANSGKPFFQLFPMTYKKPGSTDFFPVWVGYFQKLGMPIPEGKPGCNPGGISTSNKIEILGIYK